MIVGTKTVLKSCNVVEVPPRTRERRGEGSLYLNSQKSDLEHYISHKWFCKQISRLWFINDLRERRERINYHLKMKMSVNIKRKYFKTSHEIKKVYQIINFQIKLFFELQVQTWATETLIRNQSCGKIFKDSLQKDFTVSQLNLKQIFEQVICSLISWLCRH